MKRANILILIALMFAFVVPAHALGLTLVNSCQAESHVSSANINCVIAASAGNVIIATGTGAGTNAACTMNPILGINSFNFDAGALFTNYHGANKLSVEVYDSGTLATSSSLQVTLSGQCQLQFSVLIVYQFSGVTGVSAPASINQCNAQPAGVTTLSCSLTAFASSGWIIGHAAADCAACSFTNQVNTITQTSGTNFTDYMGIVKTVIPSASNAFTVTNGASFNGGVAALEITGSIFTPPSQQAGSFLPAFAIIIIGGITIGALRASALTATDKLKIATAAFLIAAVILVALAVGGF